MRPRLIAVDDVRALVDELSLQTASMRPRLIAVDDGLAPDAVQLSMLLQ